MLGYEIKFKYFHSLSCKRNLVCTIYVGFGVIRIHGSYKLKTQWCSFMAARVYASDTRFGLHGAVWPLVA